MDMNSVKTRIGELCAAEGLTVKEMCKQAGVKYTTFQSFQAGDSKSTSITNIAAIARYFKVTVEYLANEPDPEYDRDGVAVPLTPAERKMITSYRLLPEDLRTSLSSFVVNASEVLSAHIE